MDPVAAFSDHEGYRPGGVIDLSVRSLTIQNGGIISASTAGTTARNGGSITINATDQVSLTNGASITASSKGPADAGKIKLDAGKQLSVQDSKISTEAKTARGGNIEVVAKDRIHSRIAGSARRCLGRGDSGKISIDPNEVIVQNNSKISHRRCKETEGTSRLRHPGSCRIRPASWMQSHSSARVAG